MNANELIELLEQNAGEGNTPIRQAVTMLRQQQAEIEALKETLKEVVKISDRKHNAWDKAKELLK